MDTANTLRIALFTPLYFAGDDSGFSNRDLGLLTTALRARGINAEHLVYRSAEDKSEYEGLSIRLINEKDAHSAEWWRTSDWNCVYFLGWCAPRFDAIRQAILTAGLKLIEKLDTDGLRSPRVDMHDYSWESWTYYKGVSDYRKFLALPFALIRTAALMLFPSLLDKKTTKSLLLPHLVTAESPISAERIRRFLRHSENSSKNIVFLANPVEQQRGDPCVKEKIIVAIGRWDSPQKNTGMLIRVLNQFLTKKPDWVAYVCGDLPNAYKSEIESTLAERIILTGQMAHNELMQLLEKTSILLSTSRHESFHNASAEALCRGASIVGPPHIPSMPWFCSKSSGTLATGYRSHHLLDALNVEALEWESRSRDAKQIADYWSNQVGSDVVAAALYKHCENLHQSNKAL